MTRDPAARIPDHDDAAWAAEYASVPSDLRAEWATTHTDEYDRDDDAEADYYSDRFQTPDGPEDYTITVRWSGGTRTEARLLADLIRDVVRRNEERVNCPVCKGRRWVGVQAAFDAYARGDYKTRMRRCTACKDGTVLAGPAAVVTFEAPGEVGSEATSLTDVLAPRYFSPKERAAQDARFLASVRAHPSQAGRT